MLIVMLL